MDIAELLTPDRIVLDVRWRDKSQPIVEIGRTFQRLAPDLRADAVERALLAREQLGSTGLGAGFALPHARIDGLKTYTGLLVRLAKPIEFDAIDGKPVRLVFGLLTSPRWPPYRGGFAIPNGSRNWQKRRRRRWLSRF